MDEEKAFQVQMYANFIIANARKEIRKKLKEDINKIPKLNEKVPRKDTVITQDSNYFSRNVEELVFGTRIMVPLFVQKSVHYLEKNCIDQEGIYRIPANNKDRNIFINMYDQDRKLDFDAYLGRRSGKKSGNVVSAALKWFFSDNNLPQPIIPYHLHDELKMAIEIPPSSTRVLSIRGSYQKLPPANYNTLKYVCNHLYKVSNHANLNKMDEGNLAVCWWPNLFHPIIDNLHKVNADTSLCEVVRISIKQNQFIFNGKPEVPDLK